MEDHLPDQRKKSQLNDRSVDAFSHPFDVRSAIGCALKKIDKNLVTFAHPYPEDTTLCNVYYPRRRDNYPDGSNLGWTTSFWPGMLWLAYELTGDAKYRKAAEAHIPSFSDRIQRKVDVETHDLGFLYTLACIAPWRLTGNVEAKNAALLAAESLMTRYLDRAGIFQAWGNADDPKQQGRTIIDSLMNMPLLFWAGEVTEEPRFIKAARHHASRLRDHMIRPDNTTYHTYVWEPQTGEPLRGNTAQGFSDDSCWARGQAWGIYGFALIYRYTYDESFLIAAQRCADFFLDHLPSDQIAYWDLIFTDGSDEPRDSSAAAIAVCGLQEMIRWLPDARQKRYRESAETILASLSENYATDEHSQSNALLLHGVYDRPKGIGIDEGNLWGDYFYMEALIRITNPDWKLYW